MVDRYEEVNRELWNARTKVHVKSKFYDVPRFLNGKSSLNRIELDLLRNFCSDQGHSNNSILDLSGKRILHLQCHFGQDTLSMARMGAKVVGVDLSDEAIDTARRLAGDLDIDAEFVCSDVLKLGKFRGEEFDIVFSSYGTVGWLPDLELWGQTIAQNLAPGGQFILVEFHPMMHMFDDDLQELKYPYFNRGVIIENEGTYAEGESTSLGESHWWNYSLSETINALYNNGLLLKSFKEYDYSPYNCFANLGKVANGFQVAGMEGRIPMVYSLVASKP